MSHSQIVMEYKSLLRSYKTWLPLAVVFVLLVLMMPRSTKFGYDYKKGSPWLYDDLVAQFDFPIIKTEAEIQKERSRAVNIPVPYYRYDANVGVELQRSLRERLDGNLASKASDVISGIYSKGVVSDREYFAGTSSEEQSYDGEHIYVQQDKRVSLRPASDVFTVKSARMELLKQVGAEEHADSILTAAGIYNLLVPNLVFDAQTTQLIHSENVTEISPTKGVVSAGQTIVSNGEIVTEEIEQLLDSYKAEIKTSLGSSENLVWQWLGNVLLAFSIIVALFFTICFTSITLFGETNKYIYLLFIFVLCSLTACLVQNADARFLYMVPFPLFAYYLLAFFRKGIILPVYVLSLLPLLIFGQNGVELFVMHVVAGIVAMYVFDIFNNGWTQFVTAAIVFFCLAGVWISFCLVDGFSGYVNWWNLLYIFAGCVVSVAAYPLIYLFEKIFNLVSSSRLLELADTNNKALRELAVKAPGTFQHSLQVMNIADAAARSIDADVLLIRAGALYHDIGKMLNPQCFVENEAGGEKYHSGQDSKESAQEIIRHVTDGLALAEKYGLPDVIRDFIATHHGTTQTGFFYTKYVNDGGNPADIADFTYPGPKPTTKEQVILMLCDSLEAASRSLKDHSAKSISDLVDRILNAKLSEGQFDESEISLSELKTVCEGIKSYLQQIYHSRIQYPKRKKSVSKEVAASREKDVVVREKDVKESETKVQDKATGDKDSETKNKETETSNKDSETKNKEIETADKDSEAETKK